MTRRRQRSDRLDGRSRRQAHIVTTRRDGFLVVFIMLEGLVIVIVILVPLRRRRERRAAGLGVVQPALGIADKVHPGIATRGIQSTAVSQSTARLAGEKGRKRAGGLREAASGSGSGSGSSVRRESLLSLARVGEQHMLWLGREGRRSVDGLVGIIGVVVLVLVAAMGTFGADMVQRSGR